MLTAERSTSDPLRGSVGRLLCAGLALVLGWYAVTFSLAQASVKGNPALAYRLASYDGRVTAAYAASLAGPEATVAARVRASGLAKTALRQDPTAVIAVSTLGLNSQILERDLSKARSLFTYAETLSRRDRTTQLWSIEDAVARGNIADALKWYDITLRTRPRMNEILFPILAGAVSDPAIRSPLVQMLSERPLWYDPFIEHISSRGTDPSVIADLFMSLRRAGGEIPEASHAALVDALLKRKQFDQAWRYYSIIRQTVSRTSLRDTHFAAEHEIPSLLDWTLVNQEGVFSSLHLGKTGGMFEFSAPASIGGAVLQQVQLLPAGHYRLSGKSTGIEQSERTLPYWTLTCRTDGRELGRVPVTRSSEKNGQFTGVLAVPSSCRIQTLTFVIRASDALAGVSGQINHVELLPAS